MYMFFRYDLLKSFLYMSDNEELIHYVRHLHILMYLALRLTKKYSLPVLTTSVCCASWICTPISPYARRTLYELQQRNAAQKSLVESLAMAN